MIFSIFIGVTNDYYYLILMYFSYVFSTYFLIFVNNLMYFRRHHEKNKVGKAVWYKINMTLFSYFPKFSKALKTL